jgi:hypothetical protein
VSDGYINPVEGSVVEHYKGGRYQVLSLGRHCDYPNEELVVYRSLKDGTVWVRKLSEFRDMVQTDDGFVKRFKEIK